MSRRRKNLYLYGALFLLIFAVARSTGHATVTSNFMYKSQISEFVFAENTGSEVKSTLLLEAKKLLPYVLGMEASLKNSKRTFGTYFYCYQQEAALLLDGKTILKTDCSQEPLKLLRTLASRLKVPFEPVDRISAYSIEVESVPPRTAVTKRLDRWAHRVYKAIPTGLNLSVNVFSDNTIAPLWLRQNEDGSRTILFGILLTKAEAIRAAKVLNLDPREFKIIQVTFDVDRLETYFYAPSQ